LSCWGSWILDWRECGVKGFPNSEGRNKSFSARIWMGEDCKVEEEGRAESSGSEVISMW
jgi:hypothetical protein